MKIAIVSDTHGNVANFKKIVSWLNKENIDLILHCGDIGSPETLKESLTGFTGEFYGVLGNMDKDYKIDIEKYQQSPRIEVFETIGEIEINKKKIAFTHRPETARTLVNSGKYDLVFYGHTHQPWEERVGNCREVNPGNATGIFYKATFAVYDVETEKLELKILEKL